MAITWNPSDKDPGIILSNGNLTADGNDGDNCAVRATISKSSGKWYWEYRVEGSQVGDHYVGIGTSAENLDEYPGYTAAGYSWALYSSASWKFCNGIQGSYGDTCSLTDIIGVALDLDNGEIWFSRNGVWQESGNPITRANPTFTGISGTFFPMVGLMGWSGTNITTARFSLGDQTYSPPSGFNALDSLINLFDGKVSISPKIDLLDGEVCISPKIVSLDGKSRIKDDTVKSLDGKIYVIYKATNLLNGKAKIKDTTTKLFDGKTRVKDSKINSLDGKLHIYKTLTSLLDGEVTLHPIINGDITLPLLQVEAVAGLNTYLDEAFPFFELEAFTGGIVDLEFPFIDVEIKASIGNISSGNVKLPKFKLESLTGIKGSFSLPSLGCISDVSIGILASGDITPSKFELNASALLDVLANLDQFLPKLIIASSGVHGVGASGNIKLYPLRLSAEGYVGKIGTVDVLLPGLIIEGELAHVLVGEGNMEFPSFALYSKVTSIQKLYPDSNILKHFRWE